MINTTKTNWLDCFSEETDYYLLAYRIGYGYTSDTDDEQKQMKEMEASEITKASIYEATKINAQESSTNEPT